MGTHYDSCLVRWWSFEEGPARRYHLEHVQSGRVWRVRNTRELLALLQALLDEPTHPPDGQGRGVQETGVGG